MTPRLFAIATTLTLANPVLSVADEALDHFEKRVRPLLVKHCYECHAMETAEGNLRLDLRSGWKRGGNSGPAIVPGDPARSLLFKAVSYTDAKLQMPPLEAGGRLTDAELQILKTWIRNGAPDPRTGSFKTHIQEASKTHWAFQPLQISRIPQGKHPIDHFIARKLKQSRIVTTGPADLSSLIRRMTYDLLGLPPTPQQQATTREQLPGLIDSLLTSSHYGERWGRHWLDVARYSDAKDGVLMYGDARIRPFAYTYRDYVIRAFNSDKPFDQFIREQLAAEQLGLPADSPDLAAMGLLTLGRLFDRNQHDVIDDQIDVITRGFLGLTTSCARCHDHKFDPIPTADYYSLYGIFASSEEPYRRPRIEDVTQEGVKFEKMFSDKLAEIHARQNFLHQKMLNEARGRTRDHLILAATSEPDIAETTIFFLSLIPGQPRPQITYAWRQLIASRAVSGDPIFGPWHDLMNDPTLKEQRWRDQGVDDRIIRALVREAPVTPREIAIVYADVITENWNARRQLETRIAQLQATSTNLDVGELNVSNLVAGGDGLRSSDSTHAVHPVSGKTVQGSVGFIEVSTPDTFAPSDNAFVDGVFVPRDKSQQIISTTGLMISDVPTSSGATWDYLKSGPASGSTSNSINQIDFNADPHWMLSMHANKGFTVDLKSIRSQHGFRSATFRALLGHGGEKGASTIDVSIYIDGDRFARYEEFKAQQAGIEIVIPMAIDSRFITFVVTEGKDGISHDQAFLGDPRIEITKDEFYKNSLAAKVESVQQSITQLQQQRDQLPSLDDDPLAQLLLSEKGPSWFPKRQVNFYLSREESDAYRGLVNQLDGIAVSDGNAAARAMILVDKLPLVDPVIFQRGDASMPGSKVPRRFLEILSGSDRLPFGQGSGRLDLANAIADPKNPLTSRVWVNRVWMHHFGEPLVEDPSDFGLRTQPPLQLELLDFLANEFISNGFRTKPLHRLIMTSAAYQRTSLIPASEQMQQQLQRDPSNQYIWHANRRRLDLEQMRDTLLSVSGQLDETMFGRPRLIDDAENKRRTVYSFVERQNLPNVVQIFDSANADSSTARRPNTTVAQQALFAMNSPFIDSISESLAHRLDHDSPTDRIIMLYRLTLGRRPTPSEMALGLNYTTEHSWQSYAQVLLMSNELWFID